MELFRPRGAAWPGTPSPPMFAAVMVTVKAPETPAGRNTDVSGDATLELAVLNKASDAFFDDHLARFFSWNGAGFTASAAAVEVTGTTRSMMVS